MWEKALTLVFEVVVSAEGVSMEQAESELVAVEYQHEKILDLRSPHCAVFPRAHRRSNPRASSE